MQHAIDSPFAGEIVKEDTFGEVPEEIECPFELRHIWGWFLELHGTRTSGIGFNSITHLEITAWSQGYGIGITPFERRCIRLLDETFREFCNAKERKK